MNATFQKLLRLVAGLFLLAPAALVGLVGLAGPTFATFYLSLQKQNLVSPGEFVGGQNLGHLFADNVFASALTYTLSLAAERLLVVAIVPVVLAAIVSRFGRAVRWPIRLLFTVPLAGSAPVVFAFGWLEATHSGSGFISSASFADPGKAGLALNLIDGLYTYGLACAAACVVYLAALRRPEGSALPSKKPLIFSWLVTLLAVAALTIQSFTLSYALTAGGPSNSTFTLALYQFSLAFRSLQFGASAAVASLMLAALAVLGLGAGLIIVLAGLKIELGPWREPPVPVDGTIKPRQSRAGAAVVLGVVLVIGLALGVASTWQPLSYTLRSLGTGQAVTELFQRLPLAPVVANTFVPPLILVLIQVPIAYLAALGIGAVRPLGRWSEFLLLPISPWLFVTAIPLSIAAFQSIQKLHGLNTLYGLIPPLPLSVPMVFALTLFFKGQMSHWQSARAQGQSAARAVWSQLVWPSLPLVLFLGAVALLVGLHDLYWPLIVASQADAMPFSVTLLRLMGRADWPLASVIIVLFEVPIFGLFFIILGGLQCLYLDRLVLTDGEPK